MRKRLKSLSFVLPGPFRMYVIRLTPLCYGAGADPCICYTRRRTPLSLPSQEPFLVYVVRLTPLSDLALTNRIKKGFTFVHCPRPKLCHYYWAVPCVFYSACTSLFSSAGAVPCICYIRRLTPLSFLVLGPFLVYVLSYDSHLSLIWCWGRSLCEIFGSHPSLLFY